MKTFKKSSLYPITICFGLLFIISSCEKEEAVFNVVSNDARQMRKAYTDKGYSEVIVDPIVKTSCYFIQWDKTVTTPVSGLLEYYDSINNWIASIDFGDGTCDEWATKTWDVNMFPDYPRGSEDFFVFDIKKRGGNDQNKFLKNFKLFKKNHSYEWFFWWAQLGLNQRPLDYESSALTS